jgi:integrase
MHGGGGDALGRMDGGGIAQTGGLPHILSRQSDGGGCGCARCSTRRTGWPRGAVLEIGLVFTTRLGTGMDAANVRRDLRRAVAPVPGLNPADWTPRELRHSFVSLLSDAGVPLADIAQLVGHSGTTVTELVYRHQIRPVIQTGATVMDRLFGHGGTSA